MSAGPASAFDGKCWLAHPSPDQLPARRQTEQVLLVSTVVEPGVSRADARARIRTHLRDSIAQWLGLPLTAISLASTPGHAPKLWIEGQNKPGVSFSHEVGLSVAVVNLSGLVGVDVMTVQNVPDWLTVARDYLSPTVTYRLQATPQRSRALAFAKAWCQHEALLKLHGRHLTEWAEHSEPAGSSVELELLPGLACALALL
ncbi:4'-phosphopantetheinyl transferase superfamily protein [Pseudomonas syringae]|uniref:4'-phosphopantetheinyl transferase superfamily protein n=1 Tax=Pseudomonas syringae TaxID=317 RepID=UPI001F457337|nr:4'-phosphopantetheinyl transferase superfamily protein [Pseudomonas syringae]MCF5707682.1 4'-phosphopantetheinyl transferase superfamily protein [Pseudomonas syringae]